MTISSTPIQESAATSTTNTTLTNTISAATSGNTLIFIMSCAGVSGVTVSSISTTNVTWTQASSISTGHSIAIWYGVVSGGASGTTITATIVNSGSATVRCNTSEWSGINTSSQLDQNGTNTNTGTNPTTGTITPTTGLNELFIAAVRGFGTLNAGPTNGFTAGAQANVPSAYMVASNTSGTYSTDWTFSVSNTWCVVYATFKGPAAPITSTVTGSTHQMMGV